MDEALIQTLAEGGNSWSDLPPEIRVGLFWFIIIILLLIIGSWINGKRD